MPTLTLDPHEPTDRCHRWHCYIHNVDEADEPAFRACAECHHVFRTARELRRTYRVKMLTIYHWAEWRARITARLIGAKRITFCPECAHDW